MGPWFPYARWALRGLGVLRGRNTELLRDEGGFHERERSLKRALRGSGVRRWPANRPYNGRPISPAVAAAEAACQTWLNQSFPMPPPTDDAEAPASPA